MKQQTVKDKENEFFHFKNELKLRQTKLNLRICFSLKDLAWYYPFGVSHCESFYYSENEFL